MMHLGDINTINGAMIPPVDIITGGFPCQNLSMAGKRDGLRGDRSGLFFQMVRVIREMREATGHQSPRFVVVENVPGMYSSNQGRDFLEVLSELVKIKDQTLSIPMPKKGKWLGAGEIVGDGFSLAWRTMCASLWGIPQRRRRCFIVLDFNGERAGEIQFNESRLSRHPSSFSYPWQRTASNSSDTAGSPSNPRQVVGFEPGAVSRLGYGGHAWNETASTLRAHMGDNQAAIAVENHPNDSRINLDESGTFQTLTKRMGTGGGNVPLVLKSEPSSHVFGICSQNSNSMKSGNPNSGIYEMEISRTLDTGACSGNGGQVVVCMEGNGTRPSHRGSGISKNVCPTLNTVENHMVMVKNDFAYTMTTGSYAQICKEKSPTLQARDYKAPPLVTQNQYIVRRLTPQECAMLQGFPFDWCFGLETFDPTEDDIAFWSKVFESHRKAVGKSAKPKSRSQIIKWLKNPHTDSAEYRLWGNGVALPCVVFVLGGIAHEVMQNPP